MDLVGLGLRDVPVLAEEAAHVAACCAHGQNAGAGEEMVQRFLLYGIDVDRRRAAIAELN